MVRAAIVSTYPPRAWDRHLAADVRSALLGVTSTVSRRSSSSTTRPPAATGARRHHRPHAAITRGADLGRLDVDVVCSSGRIFGGPDGAYVLSLVEELSQPLVVTLHTVLSEPTSHQAHVLSALCRQAELVIVMTETAKRLLVASEACPASKVRVVPHGAPTVLARRADAYALERAAADNDGDERFVLSTFGLISPARGSRR